MTTNANARAETRSRTAARRRVRTVAALATGAALASLAAGCAGPMTRIEADERDASGGFDGRYRLRMAERERGFQNVGTWQLRCGTNGFDLPVSVVAGSARLNVRHDGAKRPDAPIQSYVDERGRFRFEVPMAREAAATGTSSSTLDNGAVKLIYQGALGADGPSRGVYTVGIGEFGYAGCSYPFEVVPEGGGA